MNNSKSEFEIEIGIENNSKRRKTAHGGDKILVKNPMMVFDLKSDIDSKNIENELDSKTNDFNFIINSHKKRNFNQFEKSAKSEKENKIFVSNIPKFCRNVNIIYSKYSDFPSQIPKKIKEKSDF